MRYYDAHNHLQDARLDKWREDIVATLHQCGVIRCVVNGTCEADWGRVMELAQKFPKLVLPSCGLHPWQVNDRSHDWQEQLIKRVDDGAMIGEVGLDRWIDGHDNRAQEEVLCWQLEVAAKRNLPVTIHCLQAWGKLLEILHSTPLPACGFLLHSYAGSAEMVPQFVKLGGYFSFSGYFAHQRKERVQTVFRAIPIDRLLIESDAPDMLPPPQLIEHPITAHDTTINHPGNVAAIYHFVAEMLAVPVANLTCQVEQNFIRLFVNHTR